MTRERTAKIIFIQYSSQGQQHRQTTWGHFFFLFYSSNGTSVCWVSSSCICGVRHSWWFFSKFSLASHGVFWMPQFIMNRHCGCKAFVIIQDSHAPVSRAAFVHVAVDTFTIKQLSLGMFCRCLDVFLERQISELYPVCWIYRPQSAVELMLVKNNKLQLSTEQRYAMQESSYERHPEPGSVIDLGVLFS